MVTIKSPLPLMLCCYLLVSFVFFPHGALSRQLLGEGGGNNRSKADVRKSTSKSASSWGGQDSHPPPSSQFSNTGPSTVVSYSRQVSNSPTGTGWNCKTTPTSNGYVKSCSKTTYQSYTRP
ncbi:hypothetical protein ES319_A13G030200v1 [Gossypium barbadense]|uniref:Uncharacterized protein n=1 Tax=Gossypium barbadense TaxID=3634 RepID=A0A2P5WG86_GOSBA|nr:hypothetical protein ES319_A13G030200v1 [Gossypium barbadense]PPR90098.1 hypothetical protein GOBAR_AA30585 [Gossypium barbadense]